MPEIILKPCPFCGSEDIYETYSQEYALGTKNPEIFCNTCKAIFAVEDDSPYLNCDEDFKYRREKTAEAWNKRAEQPEIIRCKDCEYGEQDEVGRWFCRSLGCQIGNEDGSGYCADAERRTDE